MLLTAFVLKIPKGTREAQRAINSALSHKPPSFLYPIVLGWIIWLVIGR